MLGIASRQGLLGRTKTETGKREEKKRLRETASGGKTIKDAKFGGNGDREPENAPSQGRRPKR